MGIFDNLFSKFIPKMQTTIGTSRALLYSCQKQASNPLWLKRGRLADDFRSNHTIYLLHVWMVHRRLIVNDLGKEGNRIQECLFDEFWEDTSNRIRKLGIGELSVNKYLSDAQGYSFKCCMEMDHALTKPSEDEVIDDLGGAMWRNTYARREEEDPLHILELARYVRREQLQLMEVKGEDIINGRIKWGNLPWSNVSLDNNNNNSKPNSDKSQELNEGIWNEAITEKGQKYYWNSITKETRWDNPNPNSNSDPIA